MPSITCWVLERACRQLAVWRGRGLQVPMLTVNVTDEFLLQRDVDAVISTVLGAHGICPRDLILEVNERTLLESADGAVMTVLERLKALGFNIALDDFGVGHASLIHMRMGAFSVVKIDREFVRDQEAHPENVPIIAAMADLCQRLNKTIIVEGIETSAQRAQVLAAGCRWGQGFLYARPMQAAAMTSYLTKQSDPRPSSRSAGDHARARGRAAAGEPGPA
jgi:EAL domain-containing protein (putative c-di-GMP-specific phosphodiesterase class I)